MDLADPSTGLLTRILNEWSAGDHAALERLTPLVYAELHRIAEFKMMREQHGHPLQPLGAGKRGVPAVDDRCSGGLEKSGALFCALGEDHAERAGGLRAEP
jgi:hypothetical protein